MSTVPNLLARHQAAHRESAALRNRRPQGDWREPLEQARAALLEAQDLDPMHADPAWRGVAFTDLIAFYNKKLGTHADQ